MTEYLEKSAVIKAIHDEIYSGGNWSGGWYERPEEQAEKNFTERINAITPVTRESGEWEVYEVLHDYWEGTKKYRCSRCKHKAGVFNTNFCPECGLKMSNGKSWRGNR